ncbi:hypothetical protein F4604DRAFT_1674126 [Suillus subluteus]|nr:hypothetical protein F4604DRAFT_1674126 [Suillus subluteus]
MHYRPLWEWALDMLQDQCLVLHFVFDEQQLYKFNGTCFVHFIDEPWTANTFWDSQLPPEAKPLAFILYADKAKLSSCDTQKAYLIVYRIANLPVKIQNGTGLGGGQIVGWLPIVSEDPEHTGKSSFVNFKNTVWHESFLKLLESVIQILRTGYWFECGDAIWHLLWPLILILSTNYEEHAESEEALQLAHTKKSKKGKNYSKITCCMILRMSSGECCSLTSTKHSPLIACMCIMEGFGGTICGGSFSSLVNDSSHHEDISKMAIFVAQKILHHPQRRQALQEFSALMEEYILKSQPVTGKDWNFPKKHASSHLFDNILVKGATQNYNTKPNEKMHGPMRDIYHNRTNFKDVATQVHVSTGLN